MSHVQLTIPNFELYHEQITLITNCTIEIPYCAKIGLIGRNGSGKSSLLHYIFKRAISSELTVEYVEQSLTPNPVLSGGESLAQSVQLQLRRSPQLLLLDEPTNHLDAHNREKLFQALLRFYGCTIIASHDEELLSNCCDMIWSIEKQKLNVFNGTYQDYYRERRIKNERTCGLIKSLNHQIKQNHQALVKEQQRASNSKKKGVKNIQSKKYPTVKSLAKANRGIKTADSNKKAILKQKQEIETERRLYQLSETIHPKFHLSNKKHSGVTVFIKDGSIAHSDNKSIVSNININLNATDKLWLKGDNGSGKSSILKAIMGSQTLQRHGEWKMPVSHEIGYLDQHYQNLEANLSVIDNLSRVTPSWSHQKLRQHLNDFLFRKCHEVNTLAKNLSGGEKVRLSLALIAANTPKLLILDEVTNNLDLDTKQHIKTLIQHYPGALILVCHEESIMHACSAQSECFKILSLPIIT